MTSRSFISLHVEKWKDVAAVSYRETMDMVELMYPMASMADNTRGVVVDPVLIITVAIIDLDSMGL